MSTGLTTHLKHFKTSFTSDLPFLKKDCEECYHIEERKKKDERKQETVKKKKKIDLPKLFGGRHKNTTNSQIYQVVLFLNKYEFDIVTVAITQIK
jgi:hypothetical protein